MRPLFLALLFILAGCSTSIAPNDREAMALKLKDFEAGEVSLECGIMCASSFGYHRDELRRLHDNGAWTDLASKVISTGYNDDLAWYYLARSAEGLGHYPAAGRYYQLSRAATQKCKGIFGNCDGIDIAAVTSERLEGLSARIGAAEGEQPKQDPATLADSPGPARVGPRPAVLRQDQGRIADADNKSTKPAAGKPIGEGWYRENSMILATASVRIPRREEEAVLALSHDGHDVRVSGLYSKDYYMKSFTRSPPVFASPGSIPHIAYPWFFDEKTPATVQVGDLEVTLRWDGAPHWIASAADTRALVEAFAKGSEATIVYQAGSSAKSRRMESNMSLASFAASLRSLPDPAGSGSEPAIPEDPRDLIAPRLAKSHPGLSRDALQQADNPSGEGVFVYLPDPEAGGISGAKVWFVNQGHVAKLNTATDGLTPDLPFPIEAPYEMWKNSGLTHDSIAKTGLDMVR